jgi:hypothetical protein
MKINHRRSETRRKAQEYRYTNAASNRINQDTANTQRRRDGRREINAQLTGECRAEGIVSFNP